MEAGHVNQAAGDPAYLGPCSMGPDQGECFDACFGMEEGKSCLQIPTCHEGGGAFRAGMVR